MNGLHDISVTIDPHTLIPTVTCHYTTRYPVPYIHATWSIERGGRSNDEWAVLINDIDRWVRRLNTTFTLRDRRLGRPSRARARPKRRRR